MRAKPFTYTIFFSVLVLQSCSDFGAEPTIEYYELDAREAAFRYLFVHNYSGGAEKVAQVYFLAVDGRPYTCEPARDPSADLLGRFAGNRPIVKRFSECTLTNDGVRDLQTGEWGMAFITGPMKKLDVNRIEIWGGYFVNGCSASLNRLVLRRVSWKKWIVELDELWGIA